MQAAMSAAIDAAIRTNRMEGLNLSADDSALITRVKAGEVSLTECRQIVLLKYVALGKGLEVSYEDILKTIRGTGR